MKSKTLLILLGLVVLSAGIYFGALIFGFNSATKELVREIQEISAEEKHKEFREFLDTMKTEVERELDYPIVDKVVSDLEN